MCIVWTPYHGAVFGHAACETRVRALFLQNAILHANTRAHVCARAALKIVIVFSEKI